MPVVTSVRGSDLARDIVINDNNTVALYNITIFYTDKNENSRVTN